MSRIGKLPIPVPSGVTVKVEQNHVTVEGPRGRLERTLPSQIAIEQVGTEVLCRRPSDGREHRSLHGLTRTLVANMVTGVSAGFRKDLELVGVGYRAQKQGEDLVLTLGFSHPVRFRPPQGIAVEVADPTHFAITGSSKEQVGQVAADLRRLRPPEPYKGKGLMYRGERIRRKPGKSGKGAK
ncbi:MAG TPA: 50S ribosomal protein L6 [Terriglobales bacterium]|nr:50S ribosomal protein L6 [Terriglobales bacterium]